MKKLFCYAAVAIMTCMVMSSCGSSKNIAYFQDIGQGETGNIGNSYTNVIRSGDMLSIVVSSSKPELAVPYNLYSVKTMATTNTVDIRQEMEGYTVNSKGYIDFPELGTIHVEGMTREQLVDALKDKLEPLMPNPIVTVNFLNFKITVLGEVNHPGEFYVQGDRVSILQAIGMAGDLSVYGKRNKVLVIREVQGVRQTEILDLKSKKIFDSPFFYLQQNDVVYVEPVNSRARSASSFAINFPMVVSIGSLASSIAMAVYYISR